MGYVPAELEADLEKCDTGKGTIRFPADKPLPAALVRKVVKGYGSLGSRAARGTELAPESRPELWSRDCRSRQGMSGDSLALDAGPRRRWGCIDAGLPSAMGNRTDEFPA